MDFFAGNLLLGEAGVRERRRPQFPTVEAMDAAIIDAINAAMQPDDSLYIIGNFCRKGMFAEYWPRLKQKNVSIVLGEKDDHLTKYAPRFQRTGQVLEKGYHDSHRLVMSYYPLAAWKPKGTSRVQQWNLFSFGMGDNAAQEGQIDVTVDLHGFAPLSFTQLVGLIKPTKTEAA